MFRIVAPHFVAGGGLSRYDRVGNTAPIIAYMEGWTLDCLILHCKKKNWQLEILEEMTGPFGGSKGNKPAKPV